MPDTTVTILQGDALVALRNMESNSIDAIVTDPPYGLSNTQPSQVADVLKAWVTGQTEAVPAKRGGFMGKDWDSFVPPPAVWEECLRVLKPGGHMAVFAGSRTQDLMGLSIRLAGFEIRDALGWIYGSGFPKSMDVSKAIDKAAGADREVVGSKITRIPGGTTYAQDRWTQEHRAISEVPVTTPATDDAKQWSGWGTALKPAIEPIILARKPLDGTVAQNVLAHGVGGLNIDACRVPTDEIRVQGAQASTGATPFGGAREGGKVYDKGRFPANVLLDEHAAAEMDEHTTSERRVGKRTGKAGTASYGDYAGQPNVGMGHNDTGGASRFFPVFKYQAKAPKKERPAIEREDGTKVQHPTVKPLALMEWLVTLITPEGGVVLDPFAGSGTTLQAAYEVGVSSVGVEFMPEYVQLIDDRLTSAGITNTTTTTTNTEETSNV